MNTPIPSNELERIIRLSEYDFDYAELEDQFKDLAKLASKVAGTEISLINLIDSFTQWSVAKQGIEVDQMPREDSVCTYTILGEKTFEVLDLTADERFMDKFYVADGPKLSYYFGIPLKDDNGLNLGALCVMDKNAKNLTAEKIELLKIIADEIVNRFRIILSIQNLKSSMKDMKQTNKKIAHDIRGPLGGIIGLAQVIKDQGNNNNLEEVLEFIQLIQKSGKSLLELADEILTENCKETDKPSINTQSELNLSLLKEKISDMYQVQAKQKDISLEVKINGNNKDVPFTKNKLIQIFGNLISNAIKFTPKNGKVEVILALEEDGASKELQVQVKDSGKGLTASQISEILYGNAKSQKGTGGETGYGFGLPLVKHLVDSMNGKLQIESELDVYSSFTVHLPV